MVVSVAWVGVASRASAGTSATPVVFVATGENFPDALGAAAASAVQRGPVLLVTRTSVPTVTADELTRLAPHVIYVAGGPAVVSDTVVNDLKNYAPIVERLAGNNRYDTAVEISKATFPYLSGPSCDCSALEARIAALEALLVGVTRDGDTLLFDGMNLQVVNGGGMTEVMNGLGNIVVGYNWDWGDAATRTGSHNLIVGDNHTYSGFAGIVAGESHTVTGGMASVTGGTDNTASGNYASVTGGKSNTASGEHATVTGGTHNTANGQFGSVTGGDYNNATGYAASVIGGNHNTASGASGTVTGGFSNLASGGLDVVIGGDGITCNSGGLTYVCGEGAFSPADA